MIKTFSIYDSKADAYALPIFYTNRGVAIRALQAHKQKNPDDAYIKNSEDFTLFEIGEYDEHTGFLEVYPAKQSIGVLTQLLQ